ncbi:MAG: putative toxin-antitoxin system toxin component, PIN family [Gemmatimonadota bacterium]|nr:putative toxin-antitoxin system toxin component, PIN family [Gemmatimonadota bacterium]
MRVVLDTNVLVSGIFFAGVPGQVLEAWAEERFELVLSPAIFDEYLKTCERLAASRPGLEYHGVLTTIVGHGTLVADSEFTETITADPDDDKFMLCARAARAIVVSGDRDLLDAAGWQGVEVLKPRAFLGRLEDPAAS